MLNNRKYLLIISIIIMASTWGFIAFPQGPGFLKGLKLVIFLLIIVLGVIAFISAIQKEKEGFPAEDELSNQIKYKSGYYTYMASMYLWLFIFFLKDNFPNTESMLGGGILLSVLILFISKIVVKQQLNG